MNSYNNALSISLLALVVIIVIHLLFNGNKSYESEEAFDPIKQEAATYAQQREVVEHKTKNCCLVDRSVRDNDIYLQKYLLGAPLGPQKCSRFDNNCESCVQSSLDNESLYSHSSCLDDNCCSHSNDSRSCTNCTHQDVCNIAQNAPKSTKEFSDDFFGFRDRTQINSSMRFDAVDKIQDLYLSGNLEHARGFPENVKIKDLFDCATSGPSIYKRSCVRLPEFDNMNPVGNYVTTGTPGTSLTRDVWQYPNEKIMNGGEIDNGVYGNDAYASTNFPVVRNN